MKSLHQNDGKEIMRCPSNHNLVNVNDFDGTEVGEERGHNLRHYYQQQQHSDDKFNSTNATSFRLDLYISYSPLSNIKNVMSNKN